MRAKSDECKWIEETLSKPPLRPTLFGNSSRELFSRESEIRERFILMTIKMLQLTHVLSARIRFCSQNYIHDYACLSRDIHILRTEITNKLRSMEIIGEVKKRFVRIPLRLDRVCGMLQKIDIWSCSFADDVTFGQKSAERIEELLSGLIDTLQSFHDYLVGKSARLADCLNAARELQHRSQEVRADICDGCYLPYCFTAETHAYWNTLDLLISVGKCLEEAATASLELEEVRRKLPEIPYMPKRSESDNTFPGEIGNLTAKE